MLPVAKSCLAAKLGMAAPAAVVLSSTDTVAELPFATARSSLPSPFRSPTVTDRGKAPVAKSCLAAKLGVAAPGAVVLSSTDTVLAAKFATARSSLPSTFTSPTVTDAGMLPVAKSCLAAKLGVAAPGAVVLSSTDTVLVFFNDTASSEIYSLSLPDALPDSGKAPVAKSCLAAKLAVTAPGAVVLSSTDTVLELKFATARSSLLSPFRSPTVTDAGLGPGAKFCLAAKPGVAAPGAVVLSSTETVLELRFATARSSLPSPFRSPTVMNTGLVPAAKFCLATKLGVPLPGTVALSSTDTVPEIKFMTARSD